MRKNNEFWSGKADEFGSFQGGWFGSLFEVGKATYDLRFEAIIYRY